MKALRPAVCGLGAGRILRKGPWRAQRVRTGPRSVEEATRPGNMHVLEHVSLKCLTKVWISLPGRAGLASGVQRLWGQG